MLHASLQIYQRLIESSVLQEKISAPMRIKVRSPACMQVRQPHVRRPGRARSSPLKKLVW